MRFFLIAFLIATSCFLRPASAQEQVTAPYEKGYLQDGKKVLVWDYLDFNKQLEIKVNHTTGKIYYQKPDTSDYVIFDQGEWTRAKLRSYPIPMTGYRSFSVWMIGNLSYPIQLRRDGVGGEVNIMFELDTAGVLKNFAILNDIGAGVGDEVVEIIKAFEGPWIPARKNGKLFESRFIVTINFVAEPLRIRSVAPSLPLAHPLLFNLSVFQATPGSARFNDPGPFYSLKKALASPQKVSRLSLIDQELDAFPIDVIKLEHLKVLDLERNSIDVVPPQIGHLQKLTELYLPLNKIKELPKEIGNLEDLRYLGLASNQFTKFPQSVYDIPHLEGLDLANNQLTEIPRGIGKLKKLKLISLANNKLTTLPEEFFELKKLEIIFLQENDFNEATVSRVNDTFRKAKVVWKKEQQ